MLANLDTNWCISSFLAPLSRETTFKQRKRILTDKPRYFQEKKADLGEICCMSSVT